MRSRRHGSKSGIGVSHPKLAECILVPADCFLADYNDGRMKPSLVWFVRIAAVLALLSSCALFSHQPAGHISVKAVSWKLVKKYAEPEAGSVGHKITSSILRTAESSRRS